MRILKRIWKAYSMAGAVVLTAAIGLAAAGLVTGRVSAERMRAVGEAVLGRGPESAAVPEASPPPAAVPAAAIAREGAEGHTPNELLREIERAAEDLRMWEDRIDLLGGGLEKRLLLVDERGQSYRKLELGWQRVRGAFVPLLNQLLRDAPGWRPMSEENFFAALSAEGDHGEVAGGGAGGSPAAGTAPRPPSIIEAIEALRAREDSFTEAVKSLGGLSPEVLAGIIAVGLKPKGSEAAGAVPPGAGEPARSGAGLREDQVVRLISSMEPAKVARIFKSLREEDPAGAALLLSLVLERTPGKGPGGAKGSADRPSARRRTAGGESGLNV